MRVANKNIHSIQNPINIAQNQTFIKNHKAIHIANNTKNDIAQNNHTHTWIAALSHHVLLNNFHDSFILSINGFLFKIINGNAKNVNIDQLAHSHHTIRFHNALSFSLSWRILIIIDTVALTNDHWKILRKLFILSLIPSQNLFHSHFKILFTDVITAVLKKNVMKLKTR